MNAKIICGFSGTLKTTIVNNYFPKRKFIPSPTKYFRDFNFNYCDGCLDINPIHGLAIRYHDLKMCDEQEVIMERSIYDFLFFALDLKLPDFKTISKLEIERYSKLFDSYVNQKEYYIIKNIAPTFIQTKVLDSDYSRSVIYKDLLTYFEKQEKYIEYITQFIKEYNYLELTDELVNQIINNELDTLPWKYKFKSNL